VTIKEEISSFPQDLFCDTSDYTECDTLKNGAIILHVWCIVIMFYGIALLCDNYFEPALGRICEDLGLEDDVAGATFMAAGGSAPELATSTLGVFVTKSDIGIGTIVGSATFNILFVIGICAFCAPNLQLTWWPLARDCVYYCFSIMCLTGVIFDNKVKWYEAVFLFGLYLLYVFIMYHNPKLHRAAERAIKRNNEIKTRGPVRDAIKSLLYDNNWMAAFIYAVIIINLIGTVAKPFGDNIDITEYNSGALLSDTNGTLTTRINPTHNTIQVDKGLYDLLDSDPEYDHVEYSISGAASTRTVEIGALATPAKCLTNGDTSSPSCMQIWYTWKPTDTSLFPENSIALFDDPGAAAIAKDSAVFQGDACGQRQLSNCDMYSAGTGGSDCMGQVGENVDDHFLRADYSVETTDWINLICGIIYIVEFVLKHYGHGAINYWRDPFDAFDGLLVFLVIIDFAMSSLNTGVGANARIARFARFFRVLRVLRVLRLYRTLVTTKTDASTQTDAADFDGTLEGEITKTARAHSISHDVAAPATSAAKVVPEEALAPNKIGDEAAAGGDGPDKLEEGGSDGAIITLPDGGVGNDDDEDEPFDPFEKPETTFGVFLWVTCMPLSLVMYLTIPDCAREDRAKFYPATFFLCISWIGGLSYVMVWMCTTLGTVLGIPDTIMGLTLLAGGTSIPDALSSLAVARKGHGDMAVSSSVGSNIFDILVGLPIPWILWTGCANLGEPDGEIPIQSDNLTVMVGTLFVMVALVVTCIHIAKWKLTLRLGYIFMGLYFLFLIECILLESA
jgi:Ca2+/Na+ antiporter